MADESICWVEALPSALRHIHDARGEAGLSPYEIVFGRQRNIGGVPLKPIRESEDAQSFLHRMRLIDERVAMTLNDIHRTRAENESVGRTKITEYKIGQKIWYRRPEGSGDKLDA